MSEEGAHIPSDNRPDDTAATPPSEPQKLSHPKMGVAWERVLALLEAGEISEELGRLRWSSNYTFLVSVCDPDYKALAIYKPQRGERPLWDFPDGTLCYREKAAFEVSELLGWQLIPPTALRDGPKGLGSLQMYIEHDPEVTYFNLGDRFTDQLMQMAAFDFITNNADRKGGHCLLDHQGKVWGIDHGICFHVAPKLRTVIWEYAGQTLPPTMLADLERACQHLSDLESAPRQQLDKLLSAREIEALLKRLQSLLKTGQFPEPGYGPNYPWPPV